jgi:mRNA interferase RelE/StbE
LRIEWHPAAAEELAALDRPVQVRIIRTIEEKVVKAPEPMLEAYRGELKGFHKLRVGSYRLVCRWRREEHLLTVLVVAHRAEVYSRRRRGTASRRARRSSLPREGEP